LLAFNFHVRESLLYRYFYRLDICQCRKVRNRRGHDAGAGHLSFPRAVSAKAQLSLTTYACETNRQSSRKATTINGVDGATRQSFVCFIFKHRLAGPLRPDTDMSPYGQGSTLGLQRQTNEVVMRRCERIERSLRRGRDTLANPAEITRKVRRGGACGRPSLPSKARRPTSEARCPNVLAAVHAPAN